LKRYSARINSTFTNNKKNIRFGENAYIYFKDNPQIGNGILAEGNAVTESFRQQPIIPVYDIYGGWAGTAAPGVGDVVSPAEDVSRYKQTKSNAWSIFGNVFGEVDFLKHFTIRSQFGGTVLNNYTWGYGLPSYGSVFQVR